MMHKFLSAGLSKKAGKMKFDDVYKSVEECHIIENQTLEMQVQAQFMIGIWQRKEQFKDNERTCGEVIYHEKKILRIKRCWVNL